MRFPDHCLRAGTCAACSGVCERATLANRRFRAGGPGGVSSRCQSACHEVRERRSFVLGDGGHVALRRGRRRGTRRCHMVPRTLTKEEDLTAAATKCRGQEGNTAIAAGKAEAAAAVKRTMIRKRIEGTTRRKARRNQGPHRRKNEHQQKRQRTNENRHQKNQKHVSETKKNKKTKTDSTNTEGIQRNQEHFEYQIFE